MSGDVTRKSVVASKKPNATSRPSPASLPTNAGENRTRSLVEKHREEARGREQHSAFPHQNTEHAQEHHRHERARSAIHRVADEIERVPSGDRLKRRIHATEPRDLDLPDRHEQERDGNQPDGWAVCAAPDRIHRGQSQETTERRDGARRERLGHAEEPQPRRLDTGAADRVGTNRRNRTPAIRSAARCGRIGRCNTRPPRASAPRDP